MSEMKNTDKNKKNLVKRIVIGTLAISVLGGTGVVVAESFEAKQQAKVQEAYVQMAQNDTQAAGVNLITKEEAKQIALDAAELQEADVKHLQVKLDTDDDGVGTNQYVYEVDFMHDELEYEFEIDGVEKTILYTDIESWID